MFEIEWSIREARNESSGSHQSGEGGRDDELHCPFPFAVFMGVQAKGDT